MTIKEFVEKDYELNDPNLATIDVDFDPPNGPYVDESTDIFQVGLIMGMMYRMSDDTANDEVYYAQDESDLEEVPGDNVCKEGFLDHSHHPGFYGYSTDLRSLVLKCLYEDMEHRWSARRLLNHIKMVTDSINQYGVMPQAKPLFDD